MIFLFVLIMIPFSCGLAENLLENGDFQAVDEEGLPEYWYTDAYVLEPGFTVFSMGEDAETKAKTVEIRNIGKNDARYAQSVEVEPETLYCLSGDILAEEITGGHGANLSIEGIYAFSEKLYDTDGEWRHIEYYGETGPDQDLITVFARLGGYSGESTGRACFKNLKLEKTDSVPGDLVADMWYRETNDAAAEEDDEEEDLADEESSPAWPWLLLITAVYVIASIAAIRRLRDKGPETDLRKDRKRTGIYAAAILGASMLLRLILSYNVTGYMVDVNCFLSWGHTFASVGPAGFYEATNFCDYPPLYTYILGLNSVISDALGGGAAVSRVVFRLVPSLCDLAGCWLLYRMMLKRKETRENDALTFLALTAFNPATILNSAAWGQMDGVLCLLLLGVALLAIDGKWTSALPVYVISVLVKPQALMLGPLGLTYIIKTLIKNKESRKPILIGTGISLAVLAAGVIPFSIRQRWDWLIQLYAKTLGSYPYATVNTANLYYLLGGNWTKVESTAHAAAGIILAAGCLGYGGWWWYKAKELRNRKIESILSAAFAAAFVIFTICGAGWNLVGGTAMGFAFMIVLSQAIRGKRIELLSYLGALLYILLYVFGVKMHERYLFPAILLLGAGWILLKDRRILYVLTLFTATLFVNEGIILDNSIRLGSSLGHLNRDTVWLADIISVINILGSVYAVYVSTELLLNRKPEGDGSLKPMFPVKNITGAARTPADWKPDRKLHWKTKDTIILTAITAVFAAVSLVTLGSTKAPQTEWTSSSGEEEIIFDLGEKKENFSILYFGQVSRNDFSFQVSDDGKRWSEDYWAQMDQGQCWKWKYVTESYQMSEDKRTYFSANTEYITWMSGRYVRLNAMNLGLTLNEILFRDRDGNILPVTITARNGAYPESELYSAPERLIDEQGTMEKMPEYFGDEATRNAPAQPSWWNSMYFDEIYHGRTAFEFLKGTSPYETSHPPLGKVLMTASIMIFGMTPFGWRFAGALAGILMLPGMYLIGKQLTKKTWIATFACLFMALDCMHLTQTQIATIDSFPVLFIIFSYFFMVRFLQTDILKENIRRILPNLALSGIFMGLAIASKWIGIYAGAGLAILFAWHCIRTYRMRREAEKITARSECSKDEKAEAQGWLAERPKNPEAMKRILTICLWCILFFIIIPVIIYLVSYIPYMAYNSRRIKTIGDYISEVWRVQTGMLSYHGTKNLGVDHPFYSPWWEWPIIGKPMYYASEQYLGDNPATHYSIFCFGNPVIWFGGLAALVFCAGRALLKRRYSLNGGTEIWHLKPTGYGVRYMLLFTGLLAQYLPWVLVPRGTYIYHYFASLPFLMIAMSLCFDYKEEKVQKYAIIAGTAVTVAAAVLFIILFPYASGISAPAAWLDIGKKMLRIWY